MSGGTSTLTASITKPTSSPQDVLLESAGAIVAAVVVGVTLLFGIIVAILIKIRKPENEIMGRTRHSGMIMRRSKRTQRYAFPMKSPYYIARSQPVPAEASAPSHLDSENDTNPESPPTSSSNGISVNHVRSSVKSSTNSVMLPLMASSTVEILLTPIDHTEHSQAMGKSRQNWPQAHGEGFGSCSNEQTSL